MAFGKKRDEDAGGTPVEDDEATTEAEEAEEAPAGGEAPFEPPSTSEAETNGAEAATAAGADGAEASLLHMFEATQVEADDRSALLDLAGDVELDDLLEDLQIVAVALGCRIGRVEEIAAA